MHDAEGTPPLPKQIGPYKIEGLLNKGGMSLLYLAIHPDIPHPVAVKVLRPAYFKNKEIAALFLKEASIIKMVNHPNIVQLYDSGEWDKGLYIAMEFVQGVSLRQFILQKSLQPKRALEIILQVAYALHHLHEKGVIHRDLKPENIIITETGQIKLIDFGIAHMLGSDEGQNEKKRVIGTPVYMSPEQKENPRGVTASSDLYSLAMVAYELLVGKLSHGTVHLSLLPKELAEILAHALKPDPKERLHGMVAFITDISRYIQTLDEDKPDKTPDELFHLIERARGLFIPDDAPKWNQLEIGMAVQGSENFPNKSLDFLHFGDNRYCIVIAKALESGGEALLDISTFRGMLKMALQMSEHPLKIVQHLEKCIEDDPMKKQFGLSFLMLAPDKNLLTFISCGMPGIWHIAEGSKKARLLATPNPVLGSLEEKTLLETVDNWEVGDTIVLHTQTNGPTEKELIDSTLMSAEVQAEKLLEAKDKTRTSIVLSIRRMF